MITAIIVDDEAHCISRLNNLLEQYCSDVRVLANCSNIETAYDTIQELKPDAVFMDVQLNDTTGFDLLKMFDRVTFDVVFTTAFERYAVQAFKFAAVDYLLKPIDPDELVATVRRLQNSTEKNSSSEHFAALANNLKTALQQNKKIHIPTINGFEILAVQDIIRCQSDVNYTTIYIKGSKPIVVAKTLKSFEDLLAPFNFFRVHNSHLVNLSCIKSYNKGKGGYLKLDDNTEIEVSTRRKDEFLLRLSQL